MLAHLFLVVLSVLIGGVVFIGFAMALAGYVVESVRRVARPTAVVLLLFTLVPVSLGLFFGGLQAALDADLTVITRTVELGLYASGSLAIPALISVCVAPAQRSWTRVLRVEEAP